MNQWVNAFHMRLTGKKAFSMVRDRMTGEGRRTKLML